MDPSLNLLDTVMDSLLFRETQLDPGYGELILEAVSSSSLLTRRLILKPLSFNSCLLLQMSVEKLIPLIWKHSWSVVNKL